MTEKTELGLVLFQPEIAANLGAAIRVAACFDARLEVIEPCGFPWKTKEISRVAMDYANMKDPVRHRSWAAFRNTNGPRLVLMTTKADETIYDFAFRPGDRILIGQESAGAPAFVHNVVEARVKIPISPDARSLNMAVAAAVALAEARRQVGWPPVFDES